MTLAIGLLTLLSAAPARAQSYPDRWWLAVPKEGAPSWEVLPQEAKKGEVILSKRNELGILSNFAHTPFEFRGKSYASIEGFWQMMLYPEDDEDPRAKLAASKGVKWVLTRDQVAQMVAFEAKRAGAAAQENLKKLGIDWASFEGERFPYRSSTPGRHAKLIRAAMRAKLEQNLRVREVLQSTGDLTLRPDHHTDPNDPPEWRYYDIWMEFREELTDVTAAWAPQ